MSESEVPIDEIAGQMEWEDMFESLPVPDGTTLFDSPILSDLSDSFTPLSLGEIEQLLMMDNDNDNDNDQLQPQTSLQVSNEFWSDFLLDSPAQSHASPQVVDLTEGEARNSSSSSPSDDEQNQINADDANNKNNDNEDIVDPISKKRLRQLRNRDAAVRSRERKKLYVRDLEMKSRYLEGECKRLGILLQCCFAENQALRLSLQNSKAYDASMTKQESAVLPLESLLLGSLLWFLGIICLLILPRPVHWNLKTFPRGNADEKNQVSLGRRKPGSEMFGVQVIQSFMVSKRCRASRPRMKPSYLVV